MSTTFDDIKRRVSIIEIAERHGYRIQKGSGSRTPTMKNEETGDKICVFNPTDPYTQRYFNVKDESDKGNLWDFVKRRLESGAIPNTTRYSITSEPNKCVMAFLCDYLRIPLEERHQATEHIGQLQRNQEKPVEDFAPLLSPLERPEYLHYRGMSDKTINDPLFQGKVGNVNGRFDIALPIFDAEDRMVGLEKRNTGTKLFVAGSRKGIGVWHSNVPERIERVLITESPLDCIAYHQMKPNPHTLYIAHGGNLCKGQIDTINALLHANRGKVDIGKFEFLLGADNDEAGTGYDLALIRNQLETKGLKTECALTGSHKTLTIHQGAYIGYSRFCDAFSRSMKNGKVTYVPIAKEDDTYLRITYPTGDMATERSVCQAILDTDILPFTRLEKAVLKDWNEDLKKIKEISRDLKRPLPHEEFAEKYAGKKNIISKNQKKGMGL